MEPHGQAHCTTPNVPLGRTSRTRGPIQPRVNPWSSWCWDRICYGKAPDSKASGAFFVRPAGRILACRAQNLLRFGLFSFSQFKIDDFNEAHPANASGLVFNIEDLFDLLEGLSFFDQGLDSHLLFFDILN